MARLKAFMLAVITALTVLGCSNAQPIIANLFAQARLYCGAITGLSTVIDTFSLGAQSLGSAVGITTTGFIYAVGSATDSTTGNGDVIVRAASLLGGTWTTAMQQSYVGSPGNSAQATSLTPDNLGNIFIAGYGVNSSAVQYSFVIQSANGGAPTVDTTDTTLIKINSINYTGGGSYWVAGATQPSGSLQWAVKTTMTPTATWSTSDSYVYAAGFYSEAMSTYAFSNYEVYASGAGVDSANAYHWIVRKFNGSVWNTSDDYLYQTGVSGIAKQILKNAFDGNLYAVGQVSSDTNINSWVTRRSTDAGVTWSNVDFFNYAPNQNAMAEGVAINPANGNIYVIGAAQDPSGFLHEIIRISQDQGTTWCTLSDTSSTLMGGPNLSDIVLQGVFTSTGALISAGVAPFGTQTSWLTNVFQ